MISTPVVSRAVLQSQEYLFRYYELYSIPKSMNSSYRLAKKSLHAFQNLYIVGFKSSTLTQKKAKYVHYNLSCKNLSLKMSSIAIWWMSSSIRVGRSSHSGSSCSSSWICRNFIFISCAKVCSIRKLASTKKYSI